MPIRDAAPADYDAYARLFPELGVDDPLPSRDRYLGELMTRMVVAIDADRVVGYALVDRLPGVGYVRNVVADPEHRRRGVGRAIMDDLRARFTAAGLSAWCLNVKPTNAAALALYRRCGMELAYRSHLVRVAREVALPPPAHDVGPLPAEADAGVEARLRLLPGQLASARGRAGREVLGLSRGGEVAGAAMFMAAIPGAFPFRVAEPALGPPFLAHLRARAAPDAPWLQAGIEDDEPLRDALLALGGYVALETVHMRGEL